MNIFRILLFGLLFTSLCAFSQVNDYTRYGGVDRDIAGANSKPKKLTAEEIDQIRNENVDKYMSKLKAELNLDELQLIVIKNEILSNSRNVDIIMKKDGTQEDKNNEVKALFEKTQVTINSYLNKEQKEKYQLFIANVKTKKKDKKDKKEDKPTEE